MLAGNGSGGFLATDVLEPLGADITGDPLGPRVCVRPRCCFTFMGSPSGGLYKKPSLRSPVHAMPGPWIDVGAKVPMSSQNQGMTARFSLKTLKGGPQ